MIYLHLRGSVVLHITTLGFISHGSNLQYQKQLHACDLYMMKNKINQQKLSQLFKCSFVTYAAFLLTTAAKVYILER